MKKLLTSLSLMALGILSACVDNSVSTPIPRTIATAVPGTSASPSASPTPAPTPGVLVLSTGSLAFTVSGAISTFNATEAGYTGFFNATSTNCSGISTFSPATGNGPSTVFAVTAVAAGQCSIHITDSFGQSALLQVTVTTTSGTIN